MSDYFARSAFLRYLQSENQCLRTGKPCREKHLCACSLEMEDYIEMERADTSTHPSHQHGTENG